MSDPVFPPEILDYILDLLHNEPETLKQCCLVSKSWVPRTRRYLFAKIRFYSASTFQSWYDTFPDHANSPASHVRILTIDCYPKDVKEADWIRTFSCVVNLRLNVRHPSPILSFALFHGLSHNTKSLFVRYKKVSCLELFDLICSFPLLENLCLVSEEALLEDDGNDSRRLQTSPLLTGSLRFIKGIGSAPRHLLSLPNGLRFREMVFSLVREKDLRWIRELVLKCSDTLESLDIKYSYNLSGVLDPMDSDLSKATKLKDLTFRLGSLEPRLVIAMLQTITPEHRDLRQVSIYLLYTPGGGVAQLRLRLAADIYERWLELDRLLIQCWESRSIRPKVVVVGALWRGTQAVKDQVECLIPEIMARGIIDLAED